MTKKLNNYFIKTGLNIKDAPEDKKFIDTPTDSWTI